MKITRKKLVEAITEALGVINAWEKSDAPNVNWRGASTKQMSRSVEDALNALFEVCAATSVDDDAKEIVMAIDLVKTEFDAWEQALISSPESVHPSGTPELNAAIRALRIKLPDRQFRLPEPLRDLIEAGVGNEQICKIYGFVDEAGNPDMVKLSEEKQKPGTHYDPKTWKPPAEIRRQREINEAWDKRTPPTFYKDFTPERTERPVAPETIDQLIAQELDAEQIALMKGITVLEVQQYAQEHGLPLNGAFVPPDNQAEQKKQLAAERAELHAKSHPDISDMEDRILQCAMDEMKPGDIAKALQPDWPDLTWQKVKAIIGNFDKEANQATTQTASDL